MPQSAVAPIEDRHTGWCVFSACLSSEFSAIPDWPSQFARKPVPFSSMPKRFAQPRACEAVDRPGRIYHVENEYVGEHALDRARVDVGLVRNVAAVAQATPITDQEMRVLVLHGPTPQMSRAPRLLQIGTMRCPSPNGRAKGVPAFYDQGPRWKYGPK